MDKAQRCRAIALLCRQQAGRYPEQSWKWLGQAKRWEHLAEAESTQKEAAPPKKMETPRPEPAAA